MREVTDRERLDRFMTALAIRASQEVRVYFTGGVIDAVSFKKATEEAVNQARDNQLGSDWGRYQWRQILAAIGTDNHLEVSSVRKYRGVV
jgi:hypothetical protein